MVADGLDELAVSRIGLLEQRWRRVGGGEHRCRGPLDEMLIQAEA